MEYVLITGATSSIGAAIAKSLSKKFAIILSGKDEEKLKKLLGELNGEGHFLWVCNLSEDNIGDSLKNFLDYKNIKPSHFLHVGGLFSLSPIRLQKKLDTLKSFQVNVFSAIEIITLLSKKKYKSDLKNILFFSSISTLRGKPGYAIYSSAKSALAGLMKTLAIELKPIKVNSIVIGAIKTGSTKHIIGDKEDMLNEHIPLKLGQEDTLNGWMRFLLEEDTWMTGQEVIVDGGATVL